MNQSSRGISNTQVYLDYKKSLKVIDFIFGAYNLAALIPYIFRQDWYAFFYIFSFFLFNILISLLGNKWEDFLSASQHKARQVELVRHIGGASLALLIYINTGWWQGLLILTLGGTLQLGILFRKPHMGRWLVLIYSVIFAVASIYVNAEAVKWPTTIFLSFLMVGFTFVEIHNYLGKTIFEIQQNSDIISDTNQKLRRINEEMEKIVHIVAHEIRGPLSRIIGLSHIIGYARNEFEKEEIISKITKSAHQGLEMADDILTINSDQLILPAVEKVEIVDMIKNEVLVDFQEHIAFKELTIHLKYADRVECVISKNYLRRILDNLISNAMKYSPLKSEINITVLRERSTVSISIMDNGKGFNDDDKKMIFKKFRKLSARPTAGESSSGLGLYIVKELVTKLSGIITLESEEDKGSTFTVTFPISGKIDV